MASLAQHHRVLRGDNVATVAADAVKNLCSVNCCTGPSHALQLDYLMSSCTGLPVPRKLLTRPWYCPGQGALRMNIVTATEKTGGTPERPTARNTRRFR